MTAPRTVSCERCGRPLTDDESRMRGYGPVCAAIVLGVDTHRTPVPRPHRRRDPDQIPLELKNTEGPAMSDEITRILDAAREAGIEIVLGDPETAVREIARSVLLTLDDLIEEATDRDVEWPTTGDLALLSTNIPRPQ